MTAYSQSKINRVKRGANIATYDVDQINSILDDGFLCYVGYIYDGMPITIPMAYSRREDKIYIHGSTGNRMLLSILESEKTSITVMHLDGLVLARSGLHHSVNYRSVTLFGPLQKVECFKMDCKSNAAKSLGIFTTNPSKRIRQNFSGGIYH